jgi:hypothetical protein
MAPPKKSPAKKTTKGKPEAKDAAAKPTAKPPATKPDAAKPAVAKQITAAAAPVALASPTPLPPPPIAVPALPPEPIDITDKKAIDAYQNLYDQMGELRWQLTNVDDIERIKEARDQVYDILTRLNKAQLASNTDAYTALLPAIKESNKQLDGIRKDIATIVKSVTTAGAVASCIARVLSIVTAV